MTFQDQRPTKSLHTHNHKASEKLRLICFSVAQKACNNNWTFVSLRLEEGADI